MFIGLNLVIIIHTGENAKHQQVTTGSLISHFCPIKTEIVSNNNSPVSDVVCILLDNLN